MAKTIIRCHQNENTHTQHYQGTIIIVYHLHGGVVELILFCRFGFYLVHQLDSKFRQS